MAPPTHMTEPTTSPYKDFGFTNATAGHMHRHFMPQVLALAGALPAGTRVLDVGCGNGAACGVFLTLGCQVVGIDLSATGIEQARRAHPKGRFELMEADAHVLKRLGEEPFDLVVSTEVVEHVYAPRLYTKGAFHAVREGGRFICTTPYHGYLKNLGLAVLGKWDAHADPLWDGGHIKLWSRRTLSELLTETGFVNLQFRGAGRLPWLWMTMAMAGDRPKTNP